MDMKGPVYVYYELENYFQNHRRYKRIQIFPFWNSSVLDTSRVEVMNN